MKTEDPSTAGNLKCTTPVPFDANVPSLDEAVLSAVPKLKWSMVKVSPVSDHSKIPRALSKPFLNASPVKLELPSELVKAKSTAEDNLIAPVNTAELLPVAELRDTEEEVAA